MRKLIRRLVEFFGGRPVELVAGRPVEIETVEVEAVHIRLLPGGLMDSNNASKYLNRSPKTLAMWRWEKRGPIWVKSGGRIFYRKTILDAFMRGE